MDDRWRQFGSVLADTVIFLYIYIAIIAVVIIALAFLIATYLKKKRDKKIDDPKKYVPLRISIIVVIGALILVSSPLIMGFLL